MASQYGDLSDEALAESRRFYVTCLKRVETEIARRREERLGFPHWYCQACGSSFRSESKVCPVCGAEAESFTQKTLTELMAEVRNG